MAKEVISKRNFIHENIIEELDAKYPLYSEKNGVAYSRDLKYITFEPSVDIDANIVALDMQIGFGVFNVIFYFAEEMMKGGYKVRIDSCNLDRHCLICYGKYGVPSEKVRQIVDALISYNYFFSISDGTYQYLTTCQAVYDYERCMNTRLENRRRKEKSREYFKQLKQAQNMLATAPPPLAIPQYAPQNQEYGYPADCYQEYDYPCTFNEELDELDKIQAEMEWCQQNGYDSACGEYEPPDPVGDMIQGEMEWRMQHGLNCDDAIPDDDCDSLLPPWDE